MPPNAPPLATLLCRRNDDDSFSASAIDHRERPLIGAGYRVSSGTKEDVLALMQKLRDTFHEGADLSNAPAGWEEELSPAKPLRDPA